MTNLLKINLFIVCNKYDVKKDTKKTLKHFQDKMTAYPKMYIDIVSADTSLEKWQIRWHKRA